MLIQTVDEALALIEGKTDFPADGKIELGKDFVLRVKIPNPPVNSSITPAFMEAFLELQRQLYQLSALQRKGVANAIYLSEDDKRDLDISVIVKDGSSVFDLPLDESFRALLDGVVGKMSGTEITITVIALAVLFASGSAFKAYLAYRRNIKEGELKNEDHKQALETIAAINEEDSQKYNALIELMKQNGEFGRKAVEVNKNANDALIKAATKTNETIINGISLNQSQAKSLQASARIRAEEENLILRVRIVDINRQDPIAIAMTIRDVESENDYKLNFSKGLTSAADREIFFDALKTREPIIIELKAKLTDGVIRSVEFKKILSDDRP